jgi:integrase
MTIDLRPSGNYRIREMQDGKTVSITVDHKPTTKEATRLIQKKMTGISDKTPFGIAAEKYIDSKTNVLSPSSIRGYRTILKCQIPSDFADIPIERINLPRIQSLINKAANTYSAKTVRNLSGFVMSVCSFYGLDLKSPTLPRKENKEEYIPSQEDIQRILTEVKGTKYEVPFILGTLGLRRSEICALAPEDLNGNVLSINKALVLNENNEWTLKHITKTDKSTRQIVVPEYVAELIRTNGACPCTPHSLYWKLQRVQMSLGIHRFPFHKLRHFFASYLHEQGFSDKQIEALGGWKSDYTLKKIYQHEMEMEKAKNMAADLIGNLI